MISETATKVVAITPPGAIVDNTAYTTTAIDTAGFGHVTIYALIGATDIAMAGLKVQESDASDMTDAADVTGLVMGTSTDAYTGSATTLPSATDDNKIVAFEVSLTGGRKRYLDLVATAGDGTAGTYLTAWAVLSRPETFPNSSTDRGVLATLRA